MSRIGLAPIPVPSGVEVTFEGRNVSVKGPKGELNRSVPDELSFEQSEGTIRVGRGSETRDIKALHGLYRSLIANMIEGVVNGFEKSLEIQGVGYRATKQGSDIELSVGFSHTVKMAAPEGIDFEVPTPTKITVRGVDKELVGQTAAEIRAIKKPEPYKGKGIRYENEYVRRKGGKSAKAGA
ncbi:MAG: 50S ribosomal protein L6 [Actinomycetota bacterium]